MPKSSSIADDRAVDDRAVVAEQKAAEGGYRRDPDYAAAVFGFLVVHARCGITDRSVSHVTPFRSFA